MRGSERRDFARPLGWCAVVLAASLPGIASADVRLSEILAANRFTRVDEDGESSDWAELYNSGPESVSLRGWGLSDDSSLTEVWRFPDVTIEPGGYLLVWLSGKDRWVPSSRAVSESDAGAIFEPTFVDRDARWRWLLPDSDEAVPIDVWATPSFDTSAWPEGFAGFGYGDGDDRTVLPDSTNVVFTRASFSVENPAAVGALVLEVDYDDGFVAFLNGVRVASANAPEGSLHVSSVAVGKHEAGEPRYVDLSSSRHLIVPGENVLGLVGLNDLPSSDMSLRARLGTVREILHSTLRLDAEGEALVLLDPGDEIADVVSFGRQTDDHSYARAEDGDWYYFVTPTPGAANSGAHFPGPIADRFELDPPPGAWPSSLVVSVRTEIGDASVVRFTTDGRAPGPESPPFPESLEIGKTTVLRAAAFIGSERSTATVSASYFVGPRATLPILSISMDPADFAAVHENAGARGRSSEEPSYLEYMEEGARVVATGFGLRLHGGAGRGGDLSTKKAYKAYFRGIYGDTKLRYAVIPDTELAVFDKLVLRSGFNDSFRTNGKSTYLRDQLIRDLHRDMGGLAAHGGWCMLYVNGSSRGLYNLVERMDDDFFAAYLGGADWDVIKTGNDVLRGTADEWNRLHALATAGDLEDPARYAQVIEAIDVENFTSYMIVNLWAQNHDWPHNNWYAARARVPGARWIFLCWDAEFGVGLIPEGWSADSLTFTAERSGNIRDLFVALLANEDYRAYLMRELLRHLDGALGAENVIERIDRLAAIVERDMPEELRQFGRGIEDWRRNVAEMRTFARNRPAVLQAQFERSTRWDFSGVGAVVTRVEPAHVVNTGAVVVELFGAGFPPNSSVHFDDLIAERVEFVSSKLLRATLPFTAALEGPVSIAVGAAGDSPERVEGLLSVELPKPSLASIEPATGAASGGDSVILRGANFLEGVEVFFGDARALVVEVVGNEREILRVTTPPGTGAVPVRVSNTQPIRLESDERPTFEYRGAAFLRGDANGDGAVDISDPIRLLGYLFGGAEGFGCASAADANASGAVDISDAIAILEVLFQGSATLPAPYPGCGEAAAGTPDLGCGVPVCVP